MVQEQEPDLLNCIVIGQTSTVEDFRWSFSISDASWKISTKPNITGFFLGHAAGDQRILWVAVVSTPTCWKILFIGGLSAK